MRFFRSIVIMIATILGLGILGLPFVFQKSGYGIGLAELVLVGVSMTCLYLMYAEMTLDIPGKHRYAGYMRRLLGDRMGTIAGVLFMIAMIGGMMPFLIITGPLLHALFGTPPFLSMMVLWAFAGCIMFCGMRFVVRAAFGIILSLITMYVVLMLFSAQHIDLTYIQWRSDLGAVLLPIGVALFAFGGLGAIPEMHDVLGRERKKIGKAIVATMTIIVTLYALFAFFAVGALGPAVTQNPLPLLANLLPAPLGILGLLIGTISAFSIYTVVGSELMETIHVDFGWKKVSAWLVVAIIPLSLYLAGARELTNVMRFFGSTFGAAVGLFVVLAYGKTKAPRLVPLWVRYPVGALFVLGALIEIGYTLFV